MSTIDPLLADALERFRTLWQQGKTLPVHEPDAMSVATADARGRPSVRIVLLRGLDERGFVFFTNAHSRKGEEIAANPQASLCFYWDAVAEQVRVDGAVETVSEQESDEYWRKRRRLSQIAAVASEQSQPLADYAAYAERVAQLERRYAGQDVPRPAHWLGYRVVPELIEFWEGREGRMHVRTVYQRRDAGWTKFMLYP